MDINNDFTSKGEFSFNNSKARQDAQRFRESARDYQQKFITDFLKPKPKPSKILPVYYQTYYNLIAERMRLMHYNCASNSYNLDPNYFSSNMVIIDCQDIVSQIAFINHMSKRYGFLIFQDIIDEFLGEDANWIIIDRLMRTVCIIDVVNEDINKILSINNPKDINNIAYQSLIMQ